MMMTVCLGLVSCRRAWVTHFSGDSDANQRLQDTINGSPRDLWHSFPDVVENPIRDRVIPPKRQRLQDRAPLNGERQAVFAKGLFELLQL
jgi:hypothetical protein